MHQYLSNHSMHGLVVYFSIGGAMREVEGGDADAPPPCPFPVKYTHVDGVQHRGHAPKRR
jgi:hypothetical protein